MIKCTGKRCPMQVGYDVESCQCEGCSYKTAPMTNYERIKNMSVEEMAGILCNAPCVFCKLEQHQNCAIPCAVAIKQWLESEVTEE